MTTTRKRRGFFIRLYQNKISFSGFVLCIMVVLLGLFGPVLSRYTPFEQDIRARMEGPSAEHYLGTDKFGRDLFTRITYGYRISLTIAISAVAFALAVGGSLGLIAAYSGGWIDRVLMRFMDVLLAFPIVLLAIAILAVLGPGTFNTAFALGVVYMPIFARLARGPALTVLSWDYVSASRALGASGARIIFRHVAPNIMAPITVQATLSLSTAILVEAALSFLGLGTQPPTPSLGLMLSEGQDYMLLSAWTSVFSGLAILLASFGFNLFGDGLRDFLDPTLRNIK